MSRLMRMFADSAYRNSGKIPENNDIDFLLRKVNKKTTPVRKQRNLKLKQGGRYAVKKR